MAITLTDRAAQHVQRYIEKRGKGVGLRLGVKTTGCSGLAYKLEFADEIRPEDHAFESNGVRVLIDPKSLAYLDGTQLDFVREGKGFGGSHSARGRRRARSPSPGCWHRRQRSFRSRARPSNFASKRTWERSTSSLLPTTSARSRAPPRRSRYTAPGIRSTSSG